MKKQLLILLMFPIIVFGFGSDTVKKIDTIENNTGTDITLKPNASVKVDTFTGNFVLQSGGAKEVEESATTNVELGYLSGVTSSIQTQIDNKEDLLPLTTSGDLLYHNGTNLARLAVGTPGQALIVNAGSVGVWQNIPIQSPTALEGDIIYNNGAGDVALNIGTAGQLLTVFSGSVSWQDAPVSTTLDTKGDLQGFSTVNAKVPVGADGQVLTADSAEATGVKWGLPPASSPTTTLGDMIYHGGGGSDVRLPLGTNNQVLISNSVTPQYSDISPLLNMPFKGDLLVGNGVISGTQNFNVGTDGSFLIADSNETLGMKWSDTLSGIFNPVTDWASESVTISGATVSSSDFKSRQIGDSIELSGTMGITSVSGTIEIELDNKVIDLSKIAIDQYTLNHVGGVSAIDVSISSNRFTGKIFVSSAGKLRFHGSNGNSVDWSTNLPFTWASGDSITFRATVPIVGLSSGNDAIAQNKVPLYGRYYRTGAQSSIVTNATILFNTKDNGNIDAHFNTSTGEFTTPDDRCYEFSSGVTFLNAATDSRPYINLRINGVDSVYSSDGISSNTNTLHNLSSGVICLNANDIVRVDIFTGTALSRDVSGGKPTFFSIKEYAGDYTIVAPIDSQKWECQTKALGANTSSTGVMSDLTFNNLEVGKKYKYAPNLRVAHGNTTSNEKYAVVNAYDGVTALDSMYTRSNPIEKHHADLDTSIMYTATGTTLTFDLVVSTNILLIGNGSSLNSSVTLCQLPDNYNLTSTTWN